MSRSGWVVRVPALSEQDYVAYAAVVAGAGELAATATGTVVPQRSEAAIAMVAGWSHEQRRRAALRLHADAVASGGPPVYRTVHPITVLAEHGVRWSRTDLVWSLHPLADERGLDDGGVFWLPATIAAGLDGAELEGLTSALQALTDQINTSQIPAQIRRRLLPLLGAGIERASGSAIPAHLLHPSDRFGLLTRTTLAAVLAGAAVRAVLLHAVTLSRPVPNTGWSAAAGPLLAAAGAAVYAILDRFARFDGYVHADTDILLRGLTWVLHEDPTEEATVLLGRVAVAAATAHPRSPGSPHAPRTAAAAVKVLAAREGEHPTQVLAQLSTIVRNKPLQARIDAALQRRPR